MYRSAKASAWLHWVSALWSTFLAPPSFLNKLTHFLTNPRPRLCSGSGTVCRWSGIKRRCRCDVWWTGCCCSFWRISKNLWPVTTTMITNITGVILGAGYKGSTCRMGVMSFGGGGDHSKLLVCSWLITPYHSAVATLLCLDTWGYRASYLSCNKWNMWECKALTELLDVCKSSKDKQIPLIDAS